MAAVALVVLFVRWLALPADREAVDRRNRGRDVSSFSEYEPNAIPGFGRSVLDVLRRIPPRRESRPRP